MPEPKIPDFFEPLIGWRCWSAIHPDTGGLKALTNTYYWMPGKPVQSTCNHCHQPAPPQYDSHHFFNGIGMYAFKTLHQLVEDRAFGVVVGQVKLWGTIVEHTRGYRAQFAYPHALLVKYEDQAKLLRSKWYGVEVEVGDLDRIHREAKQRLIAQFQRRLGGIA